MMKKQLSLFFILWALLGSSVFGQELFRTTSGNLLITAEVGDSTLKIRSNEVLVLLDYDRARITIKIDESSLYTGIDSIDKELEKRQEKYVVYKGKFDVDYINIDDENLKEYNVEGDLDYHGKEYLLGGKARLKNLHKAQGIQAILSLEFDVNLKRWDIDPPLKEMKSGVNFKISQSILSHHNQ